MWIARASLPDRRHWPAIASARKAMMATCCTVRRIALQMWKRDVESTDTGRTAWSYGVGEGMLRKSQGRTTMLLDGLNE